MDVKYSMEIDNKYHVAASKVALMVTEKQAAYGDSFGQSGRILEILYPNGVAVEQYRDILCIARIIDKLFRIATDKDAFGENPYSDVVGYGLLGLCSNEVKEPQ